MLKPNRAPACEYVAIPLGSSSDAPVIRPGPSSRASLEETFCWDAFGAGCVFWFAPLGARGMRSPDRKVGASAVPGPLVTDWLVV